MKEVFMPNKSTMNDPKSIWQNQPTEAFKMSADQLRLRAQELQRKTRFEVLRGLVIGVVLCIILGREFFTAPQEIVARWGLGPLSFWSIRIGFAVLCLWSLYAPYKEYQWLWPARLASDANLNTTLQVYRSGLENRLRTRQGFAWRLAKYAFLGMALVMVPVLIKVIALANPRLLLDVVPFVVLAMAWAIMFYMRHRSRQQLQQEIEQLRAFEKEYQL
jgi:hypothetical protein